MPDLTILVSPQILLIAAAIVAVLTAFGHIVGPSKGKLADAPLWRRILPVLPLVLGVAFVMIPGVYPGYQGAPEAIGSKILAGLWAGFVAGKGKQLFVRTILGKIERPAKGGGK
jgi:hypothetical protein